jgi:membrane protein DedA with SNARE-associated domain
MSDLAQKYANLSVPAKYALWAAYGAIGWGGLMLLFFFGAERAMGHDPWKHFTYTVIVCAACGAGWGALFWRKFERKIQERNQRGKA